MSDKDHEINVRDKAIRALAIQLAECSSCPLDAGMPGAEEICDKDTCDSDESKCWAKWAMMQGVK